MRLYEQQKTRLKEEEAEALYFKVELPLVSVLYRMEEIGFQVDEDVLLRLGTQYTKEIEDLRETAIQKLGVEPFNLNSPQQLSKVLFDDLKLPPKGKRSAAGSYSTDAETLEGLAGFQPGIEEILAYRQVNKLQSTYIEPLIKNRDAFSRIHTTFNQTATATGRISSTDPNLQNIPTRTPMGREVRRAFIAKNGHVLVDGDYSQIELRVLAHMSGDLEMTRAFQKGEDIHKRAAALVNNISIDEVTSDMRAAAKAVNFGIVYGISDFGLARNLGIGFYEASEMIKNYFDKYPGIKAYMDNAKKLGYENGYARTLFGRRRYLPELKRGGNIRQFGERAAMNAPIQGTAADIIKIAMVKVDEMLRQNKMKTRLILQVHDELILEAPIDEAEEAKKLLIQCMESAATLNVPLVSQVSIGNSWYECK
jgi:DNA polymerase-1